MAKRSSWGKIRKLKSGRYQASHLNPRRERVNAANTFSTRKSAEAWLATQRTLIEQGKWDVRIESAGKFYEYAIRHIDIQTSSRGTSLRESTKELYRRLLKNNLGIFHTMELGDITKGKIDGWWHTSTSTGKITTASKSYKLLHAVMNRALLDGHVTANPCRIRGAHAANTGKKLNVPSVNDVGAIISAISPNLRAAICLAAYGGLRFGEWSCLTREDLELIQDPRGNYFRIRVSKAAAKVGRVISAGLTKSEEGVRVVDLPSRLTGILSTHLLQFSPREHQGLVFASRKGDFIRHDVFIKQFNKAVALAGVERTNPHALRHFGASQKVEMGMTFPQLKKWLGDKTNEAALRYIHATVDVENRFREMPVSEELLRQI